MRVAVVELRDIRGRKRPRADVLAEKPVFGYLIFEPGGAFIQSREDSPPTVGGMLSILHQARVTRIGRGGMVITGAYVSPDSRGPIDPLIPQAWWVRPVGQGGISAS